MPIITRPIQPHLHLWVYLAVAISTRSASSSNQRMQLQSQCKHDATSQTPFSVCAAISANYRRNQSLYLITDYWRNYLTIFIGKKYEITNPYWIYENELKHSIHTKKPVLSSISARYVVIFLQNVTSHFDWNKQIKPWTEAKKKGKNPFWNGDSEVKYSAKLWNWPQRMRETVGQVDVKQMRIHQVRAASHDISVGSDRQFIILTKWKTKCTHHHIYHTVHRAFNISPQILFKRHLETKRQNGARIGTGTDKSVDRSNSDSLAKYARKQKLN